MAWTGTEKKKTGLDYMDDEVVSPFDYPMTAADLERMQSQAMLEYGTAAGVGLLGSGAQLGLSFIPTAADTANKEELAKLQARAKKGELGLTGRERETYERGLMNPVRAMATETQMADEARIAARGQGASAADIVRAQRESQRRVTNASLDAAQKIEGEHLAEARREAQELSERLQFEANKEKQRIEMIGQTLAGVLKNVGGVVAAGATKATVSDGQVLAMMGTRNADGSPMYPGLRGRSLNDARALVESGDAYKIMGGGNIPSGMY